MDQPWTKRRGPLTLLATSRKVRRWSIVVAVMLLVPMLYFLSSGPA